MALIMLCLVGLDLLMFTIEPSAIEPMHEKTSNFGFKPVPTQIGLSNKQAGSLRFWI